MGFFKPLIFIGLIRCDVLFPTPLIRHSDLGMFSDSHDAQEWYVFI